MNVNHLITEYVLFCDNFAKVFDFPAFVPFWKVANEIPEERLREQFNEAQRWRRDV